MNAFLQFGLSNTVIAGALALVALVIARYWKNPHVARALWLLVLVKLLMPPLVSVSLPFVRDSAPVEPLLPELTLASSNAIVEINMSPGIAAPAIETEAATWNWEFFAWAMVALWLVGSAVVFLIGIVRIARFHRLLKQASPPPEFVERLLGYVAGQVGLRRAPLLRVIPGDAAPFVWPLGWRCTIVLPQSLVRTLDRDSLSNILLHELAHIRRGDHLVRWLEVAATVAYWWNPVLWLARRELHKAEETSCDAWVTAEFPARRRAYAYSLLNAAEKLLPCPRPAALAVAAFSGRSLLAQRIELLVKAAPAKGLSTIATILIGAVALVALPCAASLGTAKAIDSKEVADDRDDPVEPPFEDDNEEGKGQTAIDAAKFTRFALAELSKDGKAVRVLRGIRRGNVEVTSDYKWANIEVYNAGGERLAREAARLALNERRVVVVVSGTRPIEEYAPMWNVLEANTPVIQLKAPAKKALIPKQLPGKLQSIENLGGTIKVDE